MNLPELTGYQPLLPLDQSGAGERWVGCATSSDTLELVVVEFLAPDFERRDGLVDRLLEATRRSSSLDGDDLVATRGTGEINGRLAVVHDFPGGDALVRLMDAGRPSMRASLRLVADLIDTLADLHSRKTDGHQPLYHGAITPSVVHLDWSGRLRLARIGTERWIRANRRDRGRLTPQELLYLAPEHCRNAPVDRRTDIFNVGVLLWELLTGRALFANEEASRRMQAICQREAPPPRHFNDAVPPMLDSLTLKMLAIPPEQRFSDATALKDAFDEMLSRANQPPSVGDVVGLLRSVAPTRLKLWQRVEDAARSRNLRGLVDHLAVLYGVDPQRATIDRTSGGREVHEERTRRYGDESTRRTHADDISPESGVGDFPDAPPGATLEVLVDAKDDPPVADGGQQLPRAEALLGDDLAEPPPEPSDKPAGSGQIGSEDQPAPQDSPTAVHSMPVDREPPPEVEPDPEPVDEFSQRPIGLYIVLVGLAIIVAALGVLLWSGSFDLTTPAGRIDTLEGE